MLILNTPRRRQRRPLMFKKIFLTALAAALLTCAYAQEKTSVEMLGKNKGSVKILKQNGVTYVEARKISKLFKMQTSWFGKSGQLNLKNGKGWFCVLRTGSPTATANGKEEKLESPPRIMKGELYAPLSFFSKGSIAAASGYEAVMQDGKIKIGKKGSLSAPAQVGDGVKLASAPPPVAEAIASEEEPLPPPTVSAPEPKALPKTIIKTLPPAVAKLDNKPGKKTRRARILIDPGHGGKDPGAVRSGSAQEKELNLNVAKELHALLSKDKDFEVKMTRGDDTFIPLGRRAKLANEFKADIFISIHTNAAKRGSAEGFEVYFRSDKASSAEAAETAALENEALQYEGKSPAAVSFADLLLKSMAGTENMNESSKIASHIRRATAKNSKAIGIKVFENSCIKQANFYVLRGVEAPSVLVEMGYMSNTNDRKRLNNKASRAKIAESVYDGLISYAKAEGWK